MLREGSSELPTHHLHYMTYNAQTRLTNNIDVGNCLLFLGYIGCQHAGCSKK